MNTTYNNQEYQTKLEQNILSTLSMNINLLKESDLELNEFSNLINQNIYYSLKKNLKDESIDLMGLYQDLGEDSFNYYLKIQESYVSNSNYESDVERLHECNRIKKANELIQELNNNNFQFNEFTSKVKEINDESSNESDDEWSVKDIYDLVTSDSKMLSSSEYTYMQSRVGFVENTLNIISARPSVGKSAFALNLLNDFSKCRRYKCIYLNMEMTEKEIYERLIAMNTGINIKDFPKAKTETNGVVRSKILNHLEEIKSRNILILNKSMSLNGISYLVNRERRKKVNQDKHIILFIDYLGYIRGSKATNDRERMGEIVRSLQVMTKDFHCTIFLLAQINREGAENPTMENLKDTGELEQSGHCVMILDDTDKDPRKPIHRMKVHIAKNRSGSRGGNLYFNYNRDTQKFTEVQNGM